MKLRDFASNLNDITVEDEEAYFDKAIKLFDDALLDDIDTPRALSVVFSTVTGAYNNNFLGSKAKDFIKAVDDVLRLNLVEEYIYINKNLKIASSIPDDIKELAVRREAARIAKDYKTSDSLRLELEAKGYIVEDSNELCLVKIRS